MNTHGIGIMGDRKPWGADPILAPLAHTGVRGGRAQRERYLDPATVGGGWGGPSYSTFGYEIWNVGISCMGQSGGERRVAGSICDVCRARKTQSLENCTGANWRPTSD